MGTTTTVLRFPEGDRRDETSVTRSPASQDGRIVVGRMRGIDHEDELSRELARWRAAVTTGDGGARFSLAGRLGQGSQGVVFALRDRDCQRTVALKTLLGSGADDEEVARFLHEVQVTAQLEHPGIVPVHDLGVLPDGTVFYTMKRVEGASLAEWMVERAGSAAHRFEVIQLFLKLTDAMAFAHSRGVVHRDLKPRNIMVGTYGEVLVMDWGLAKVIGAEDPMLSHGSDVQLSAAADHETVQGTAVGTPAYMSPEQARGDLASVDHRADIYAMGVLLYELLAGASPYIRGDVRRTIQQVVDGQWMPLERQPACRRLPRRLIAVVHKALAHSVYERYQHVSEMAGDLRAFLAGEAVSAHRETPAERLARLIDRHRRAIAWGTAGVLIVIAVSMAAIGWIQRGNDRTVAKLRETAALAVAANDLKAARAANERILGLRPDDSEARSAAARFDERLRNENDQRVKEETQRESQLRDRAKAANLRALAAEAAAKGGIDDLRQAAELCRSASALHPENAQIAADHERYVAERSRLEAEQAERDRRQVARTNAEELARGAASLEKSGDLDGAIGALKSAVGLVGDPAWIQHVGELTAQQAEKQRADELRLREDEQAAARTRRRAEADQELKRADVALAAFKPDDAQDHAERAAALVPDHPGLADARTRIEAGKRAARAREADDLLAKATSSVQAAETLRGLLTTRKDDVRRLAAELGDSGDAARRAALSAAEDACSTAARDRAARLAEVVGLLNRALAIAPDHPPVRSALAGYWIDRLVEAEEAGDIAAGAAAEAQARAYDDGRNQELLTGVARVVNRGPVAVTLRPILRQPDRTDAASGDATPVAPGGEAKLQLGRYLVVAADGVRLAIRLGRGQTSELALPPRPGDLPAGVAFLPGGPIRDAGGRETGKVAAFAMMQREVTCGEYLEFLNDRTTREEIALGGQDGRGPILYPRRNAFDKNSDSLWTRGGGFGRAGGTYVLEDSKDGSSIDPAMPVANISHDDACAFAAWRARRDGRPWRLPTIQEWQFAVQCGDGRPFPWGSAPDLSFCASHPVSGRVTGLATGPGGRFPTDCSVQGVTDLAGSRSEFCAAVAGVADLRPVMGGSVYDRGCERFDAWARKDVDHRNVHLSMGMRLAYTP